MLVTTPLTVSNDQNINPASSAIAIIIQVQVENVTAFCENLSDIIRNVNTDFIIISINVWSYVLVWTARVCIECAAVSQNIISICYLRCNCQRKIFLLCCENRWGILYNTDYTTIQVGIAQAESKFWWEKKQSKKVCVALFRSSK